MLTHYLCQPKNTLSACEIEATADVVATRPGRRRCAPSEVRDAWTLGENCWLRASHLRRRASGAPIRELNAHFKQGTKFKIYTAYKLLSN